MPDSKFFTYVWHRARLTVKINFEEALVEPRFDLWKCSLIPGEGGSLLFICWEIPNNW